MKQNLETLKKELGKGYHIASIVPSPGESETVDITVLIHDHKEQRPSKVARDACKKAELQYGAVSIYNALPTSAVVLRRVRMQKSVAKKNEAEKAEK